MNVTMSGTPCQVWAASQPHESYYPELGEHKYCRNPEGDPDGVWCHTTDPDEEWDWCDVIMCPKLKVLDFSDHDHEPDTNGAFLIAGFVPESFTICSALMADAWTTESNGGDMFRLYDDDAGRHWGRIYVVGAESYTEYN